MTSPIPNTPSEHQAEAQSNAAPDPLAIDKERLKDLSVPDDSSETVKGGPCQKSYGADPAAR